MAVGAYKTLPCCVCLIRALALFLTEENENLQCSGDSSCTVTYHHLWFIYFLRFSPSSPAFSGGAFQWDQSERLLGIKLSLPEVEITERLSTPEFSLLVFSYGESEVMLYSTCFIPNGLWLVLGSAISGESQPKECVVPQKQRPTERERMLLTPAQDTCIFSQ